ncbi:hypothetical protein C8F01DRAFT_1264707 [Mycena amicta]|nr:hypothetical protein C8F01DRAFT_1264707 [Mycena amicta]
MPPPRSCYSKPAPHRHCPESPPKASRSPSSQVLAEHEYLEFKLTDTGDIDEVLPKKGYLTTYLAYHCACNVDLVQEASAEARRRLDAVAKHAQGSAQHFDALEAFFLASPAPALDELDTCR